MQTENKNPEYMLLFRGNQWHKGLSPEEMQQVTSHWMTWFEGLAARGQVLAGSPLECSGKLVSGKNGRVVADGPFAESKEAIAGYFLLRVDTLEQAVAIARDCPGLPYGIVVEVRPVAERCPLAEQARAEAELAAVAS